MVRVDNRQDSDQPHYYSQFWIDVAMGKTGATPAAAAAPSEAEDEELDDLSFAAPEAPKAKPSKSAEKKPDAGHSTLTSFADLANIDLLMKNSAEMDDAVMPDITAGLDDTAGAEIGYDATPEADETAAATDASDETFYDDEEEDDEDWDNSRRKKGGKPKRHERRTDY